ncbi:hypothetical protein D3C79_699470 [compost metagenome]
MTGQLQVLPQVGIQRFETLEPGQVVPATVIEVLEAPVAGFIGVVVPVFEAQERALPLAIDTEVGEALEGL